MTWHEQLRAGHTHVAVLPRYQAQNARVVSKKGRVLDRTSMMSACSYTSFMHRDMKWATFGWNLRRSGCHGPEKGNSAGLYTRGGSKVGEVLFTRL